MIPSFFRLIQMQINTNFENLAIILKNQLMKLNNCALKKKNASNIYFKMKPCWECCILMIRSVTCFDLMWYIPFFKRTFMTFLIKTMNCNMLMREWSCLSSHIVKKTLSQPKKKQLYFITQANLKKRWNEIWLSDVNWFFNASYYFKQLS